MRFSLQCFRPTSRCCRATQRSRRAQRSLAGAGLQVRGALRTQRERRRKTNRARLKLHLRGAAHPRCVRRALGLVRAVGEVIAQAEVTNALSGVETCEQRPISRRSLSLDRWKMRTFSHTSCV